MAKAHTLSVEDRTLKVSNLDKVYYPETGFTKGEVIDYYIRVAPVLLPYLKQRAITLKRYPEGVEGEFFYEKECPSHAPEWIRTTNVKRSDGSVIHYCVLDDLPSLVWAANLANLELHPFLHKVGATQRPTGIMFDLDPGPPADIVNCCGVAILLRDLFRQMDLDCLVKTSGSKGMQLFIPLNSAVTYRRTKAFAHAVADALATRFPEQVVSDMKKSLRKGKVLIDWSQNDDAKTTVCAYSLRAGKTPLVSTPLQWGEVEKALKKREAGALRFTPDMLLKRVDKLGDLYEPALKLQQKLPPLKMVKS